MIARLILFWTSFKSNLRVIYLQDKTIVFLFLFSLILNLALYGLISGLVDPAKDQVILHYNIYFGIDLLGSWYGLYIMPAVGTFLFLVNFGLLFFAYKKEAIIGYFLAGATLLAQLFLVVGGSLLLWFNF